jgi:hypothetical protein
MLEWFDIVIILGIVLGHFIGTGIFVKYRTTPQLFAKGEQWMGGAIGRFMRSLTEQASKEEGAGGSPGGGGSGVFKIAGMKISISDIMQLAQLAKQFGFLKGDSGGGVETGNMGL